ncbi:aspartate kinase [Flavipsychrobacter stenotrophus]|nr:aspartate kinase [Flavipsychrobacter stenotrophus]
MVLTFMAANLTIATLPAHFGYKVLEHQHHLVTKQISHYFYYFYSMRVFKFGGASIATPEKMEALLPIISNEHEPVLLVVSALGKSTNALEKIVNAACAGNKNEAIHLAEQLELEHLDYARALLDETHFIKAADALHTYFNELKRGIKLADSSRYDFSYDQVVCLGEICSTLLLHFYLVQKGLPFDWVDARTVIRTDDTYRDAGVDWNYSKQQVQAVIGRKMKAGRSILTQGFIGATINGDSVTLGREGSDYTAAMLAAMLQLESVTIWKDVEGFLNADPKMFSNTVKIEALSYNEVIEMAFYGAQIIHPKTIKPLQNNNIPLYVKCFLDPSLSGTTIQAEVTGINYPPLIVLKHDQVLLQVTSRDFSFITEDNLSRLYALFHAKKIKVNLIQNAAISFVACIDNRADKIKDLTEELNKDYKVLSNENVSLLTIRHYTPEVVEQLTANKQILLKQETRKTLQVVMK